MLEDFQNISNIYANLIINAIVSGNKFKLDKIKNGEKYTGSNIKYLKLILKNIKKYPKKYYYNFIRW